MEEQQNEQKTESFISDKIKITAVVVIIAVLAVVFYAARVVRGPEQGKQEIKNIVTPEVVRISEDNLQKEMPQGFPESIPLNGNTKVIESYSATYPNLTAKQSTISFESKNTQKQNYDFYLKWAKDNKWEIINQTNEETSKSLYLRKENKDLKIIIINNKVNITYVEV